MNLYLSGMVGAGKTALGQRLAAALGWPFRDLDREVERDVGEPFHELVRRDGWLAFREAEYEVVRRFAALSRSVLALGGGTVRYRWNVDALRGTGLVVLLLADLSVLAARVRAADRPRVHPGTTLEDDLARIWAGAHHRYRAAADLVHRTDLGRTPDQEAEALLHLVRPRLSA